MDSLTKLDPDLACLLCCPLCKGSLRAGSEEFRCVGCGSAYPLVAAGGGSVYDFRIQRPAYLTSHSPSSWEFIQHLYEDFDRNFASRDDLQEYLAEIDSVKEIYTDEFRISGSVLDVGGHQGRLRHYLPAGADYVSVDPFIDVFRSARQPNLRRAYPCLASPCNFLSCYAENLPFVSDCFDWVHMRSVVDHFADPYVALKEAWRVLKPGCHVLIGLAIVERLPGPAARALAKLRTEGVLAVLKAAMGRLAPAHGHDHNVRLGYSELRDLLATTGFEIEKEHWQKPPYTYVIYMAARKLQRQ